jgi:hypothetical protein
VSYDPVRGARGQINPMTQVQKTNLGHPPRVLIGEGARLPGCLPTGVGSYPGHPSLTPRPAASYTSVYLPRLSTLAG